MVVIAGLTVFPVKSVGGSPVVSTELTTTGLRHDREFMLVRPDRRHISQREAPTLALMRAAHDGDKLTVHPPGGASPLVHVPADGPALGVTVHGRPCQGVDQGDEAAEWFSAVLGRPCRLVRFTGERPTTPGDGILTYAGDRGVAFGRLALPRSLGSITVGDAVIPT